MTIFPESRLIHTYIDPLDTLGGGLEIGASAHNPTGLKNCRNVDFSDSMDTIFKHEEVKMCGRAAPVDIVAYGDEIPLESSSQNYLINLHVFEHLPNPIKALLNWHHILKPKGLVYSVIPYRDALDLDKGRPLTTLEHIMEDFKNNETCDTHPIPEGHGKYGHLHLFDKTSYEELISYVNVGIGSKIMFGQPLFEIIKYVPTCDKVPNGF